MEYTKNGIRETKKRIIQSLDLINKNLPGKGNERIFSYMVDCGLDDLIFNLNLIQPYIVNADAYTLAVDMVNKIEPVLNDYFSCTDGEIRNPSAHEVRAVVNDLKEWMDEYEEEHPEQMQPASPSKTQLPQNEVPANSSAFAPSSDELDGLLSDMQASLFDEGIIGQMSFVEFVSAIYSANFKTMYDAAKESRSLKRLYLIIQRIKTWFPPEWEGQAASSMGQKVKSIRNITPSEIRSAHPKWFKDLDKIFPKYNPKQ